MSFCTIFDEKGRVALDKSIMVKGKDSIANSKILEGFVPPYGATVVDKLEQSDIKIKGYTNSDEFGVASVSNTENVLGAVKAVREGQADFALCNDVWGKARRQAAANNLVYIHPTYGTVSRFGLVQQVSSMDQIGIVCKTVSSGFDLLSKIAGNDKKDGVMFAPLEYKYSSDAKNIKIGIPTNTMSTESDNQTISEFAKKFDCCEFELAHFDVFKQIHYILSCAEISNNINRYDGIKFGYRSQNFKGVNDLYIKTRTEGFGFDTKLAAIMGCMVLSQEYYEKCYDKAMRIRNLVKKSLDFSKYDVIILPVSNSDNLYENTALTALATLCGLPSVSFSYNGCAMQLVADVNNENALFSAVERGCK